MSAPEDADLLSSAHDFGQADRFLKTLDPTATKFTFALFSEDKSNPKRPIERHTSLKEAWPTIIALNQPGERYGVFVTINETDFKGRTAANIIRPRSVFIDADSLDSYAKAITIIRDAAVKPSMLVKSSSGRMHAYWLADDLPLDEFKPLQKALAVRFGSDPQVVDLPRVMRLPGTLHLKGAAQRVALHAKDASPRYRTAEIVEAFRLDQSNVIPLDRAQRASVRLGAGFFEQGLPDNHTLPRYSADVVAEASAELSGGIEPQSWFDILPDADKDEALKRMLDFCPDLATGGYDPWIRALMAASRSGAPNAETIARAWSAQDARHTDKGFDERWESFGDRPGGVSIGTLIAEAGERGFDRQGWRDYAEGLRSASPPAATESADVSTTANKGLTTAPTNATGGAATAFAPLRPLSPSEASAAVVQSLLGAAQPIDLNTPIPHRQFVLGSLLLRGEVTILAAPGGRAKTALATAWACSLSCGRALIGDRIHGPPKRVVYLSTEDNRPELQRRFRAAAMAHSLTSSDLANIQIIGVDRVRFTLTGGTERAPTVNQNGLAALARLAGEKKADVLVLDPLGPLVPTGLNDNGLMGGLLLGLKQAAVGGNFALLILHHFKKGGDGSAESISGASAIVNHARAALTIESMDYKSAEAFGVWPGDQYRWLRVVSLKANLTPPASSDDWLHLASVTLPNAEPPDYPYGDSVQAIVKPIGGPTATRLDPSVQAAIEREFVKCVRAAQVAGNPLRPSSRGGSGAPVAIDVLRGVVMKATSGKPNDAERIAGTLLEDMEARGVIMKAEVKGANRNKRTRIVPGPKAPAE